MEVAFAVAGAAFGFAADELPGAGVGGDFDAELKVAFFGEVDLGALEIAEAFEIDLPPLAGGGSGGGPEGVGAAIVGEARGMRGGFAAGGGGVVAAEDFIGEGAGSGEADVGAGVG
jgi:hypothetical protein